MVVVAAEAPHAVRSGGCCGAASAEPSQATATSSIHQRHAVAYNSPSERGGTTGTTFAEACTMRMFYGDTTPGRVATALCAASNQWPASAAARHEARVVVAG